MSDDAEQASASDRRRHARVPAPVAVDVVIGGDAVSVARVVDVSVGGVLVELFPGQAPPALAAHGSAVVRHGDAVVTRGARVVRVRWGGRERGVAVPAAVALVFDDSDDDAAARLEALLASG